MNCERLYGPHAFFAHSCRLSHEKGKQSAKYLTLRKSGDFCKFSHPVETNISAHHVDLAWCVCL